MGDLNQYNALATAVPVVQGRVLEIGSKDYGSTTSFRSYYPNNDYVGLDMEAGASVDVVVDLRDGIGPLEPESFELVICCSVLEHTDKPWVLANNLTRLVQVGGWLYLSVPWAWRYHKYPDDFFRYSPRAVRHLFPAFQWERTFTSTTTPHEQFEITESAMRPTLNIYQRQADQGVRAFLPSTMNSLLGRRLPHDVVTSTTRIA